MCFVTLALSVSKGWIPSNEKTTPECEEKNTSVQTLDNSTKSSIHILFTGARRAPVKDVDGTIIIRLEIEDTST